HMDPVLYWNSVLLEVSRQDFTIGLPGGQQPGPIRTSRAMAIVHLAIHDAVAYVGSAWAASYLAKQGGHPAPPAAIPAAPPAGVSVDDVIAGAAVTTLKTLYEKSHDVVDAAIPPVDRK